MKVLPARTDFVINFMQYTSNNSSNLAFLVLLHSLILQCSSSPYGYVHFKAMFGVKAENDLFPLVSLTPALAIQLLSSLFSSLSLLFLIANWLLLPFQTHLWIISKQ